MLQIVKVDAQVGLDLCCLHMVFHTSGLIYVSGKFALSGKKKEKNKAKVVPDYFALGAIVWAVQVRSTT